MTNTTKPLNDRITVTVNGEDREILMSFGLLNRLTSVVGSPENIGVMFADPTTQRDVLTLIFLPKGTKIENFDFEDKVDLSKKDAIELLNWSSEHVLDFFITAMEKAVEMGEKNKGRMEKLEKLMPSPAGSNNSQ